jgi:hypothetical protein
MIPRPEQAWQRNEDESSKQKLEIDQAFSNVEDQNDDIERGDELRRGSMDLDEGFEVTEIFDLEAGFVRDVLKPHPEESPGELGVEVIETASESARFLPAWRSLHEVPADGDKDSDASATDGEYERPVEEMGSAFSGIAAPARISDVDRSYFGGQSTIELGIEIAESFDAEAQFVRQSCRGESVSRTPEVTPVSTPDQQESANLGKPKRQNHKKDRVEDLKAVSRKPHLPSDVGKSTFLSLNKTSIESEHKATVQDPTKTDRVASSSNEEQAPPGPIFNEIQKSTPGRAFRVKTKPKRHEDWEVDDAQYETLGPAAAPPSDGQPSDSLDDSSVRVEKPIGGMGVEITEQYDTEEAQIAQPSWRGASTASHVPEMPSKEPRVIEHAKGLGSHTNPTRIQDDTENASTPQEAAEVTKSQRSSDKPWEETLSMDDPRQRSPTVRSATTDFGFEIVET